MIRPRMTPLLLLVLIFHLGKSGAASEGLEIYTRQANNETSVYTGLGTCEVARVLRTACGPARNMTENDCLSYGCCWDPTHDELDPEHCYEHSVKKVRFKPDAFVADQPFCTGDDLFLLGDANGDGISDQFCFGKVQGNLQFKIRGIGQTDWRSYEVELPECKNSEIMIDDVNADGRADIVCMADGGVMVWESRKENTNIYMIYDSSSKWKDDKFGFCEFQNKRMFLSDFTGHMSADALCVPRINSSRSLAKGDMAGTFKAPIQDPNFIGFCHDDELLTGDFDGDGRSDLVCRMNGGSQYQIALSDGDGLLVNEDFTTVGSWCEKDGDTFLVADPNGDHHDDWICRHADGSVCTKYNAFIFGEASMFQMETCDKIGWCKTGSLSVGDFNKDGMDDLYCHTNDGNTSVAISTVKAPRVDFVQIDWNSTDQWEGQTFCADKELYVLDTNGNKKGDLVCHNNKDGRVQKILGNSYGQPIISDMWNSSAPYRFCNRDHKHPEYGRVLSGDSNDDQRQELFCHEPLTGDIRRSDVSKDGEFQTPVVLMEKFCEGLDTKVVAFDLDMGGEIDFLCRKQNQYSVRVYGDDAFGTDTIPLTSLNNWCSNDYDELLPGHFMETNIGEILCHNRQSGSMSLLTISRMRETSTQQVTVPNGWCTSENNQKLLVGDWNGDRFTDLLCHNQTGNMKVLLNQADHKTHSGFFAKEFDTELEVFCPWIGGDLQVFDVNHDGYDDLICHTSTGVIQISESHIVKRHWGVTIAEADAELFYETPCTNHAILCLHDGECVNEVYKNGSAVPKCKCINQYGGISCEIDEHPCRHDPCKNNGACSDIADISGNFTFSCKCTEFTWEGPTCEQQYNPCSTHMCENSADCIYEMGKEGYNCSCPEGEFTGTYCEFDINPCRDPSPCQNNGVCTNQDVAGQIAKTYNCSCVNNYHGTHCELEPPQGPCDSNPCQNGGTCEESIRGASNERYTCHCEDSGYNGINCEDNVDECARGTDNCDVNAECTDTPGSFNCSCNEGFIGDGQICNDVDEYAPGTASCHPLAECSNTVGSFMCTCNAGYEGDGINSCTNVNECTLGRDNCDINAKCTDTPGAFECSCNEGFVGDGQTCNEQGPCDSNPCQNGGTCVESNRGTTNVSYTCGCEGSGYNGINCEDKQLGPSTYFYKPFPLSWSAAKTYCECFDGHLVIVNTPQKQRELLQLLQNDQIPENECAWIGASTWNLPQNKFKWIEMPPNYVRPETHGKSLNETYNNFKSGYPDEGISHQYGVCIEKDGTWKDRSSKANIKLNFICEWNECGPGEYRGKKSVTRTNYCNELDACLPCPSGSVKTDFGDSVDLCVNDSAN